MSTDIWKPPINVRRFEKAGSITLFSSEDVFPSV